MDFNYDESLGITGNRLISYGDADYLKNVICWIANNGKVNQYLKTDLTRKHQQDVINLCKEIKSKLNW